MRFIYLYNTVMSTLPCIVLSRAELYDIVHFESNRNLFDILGIAFFVLAYRLLKSKDELEL
jgi:hypothetical protein